MKNLFYKTGALALFASVLLTGCDPEIDTPASSAGQANFTKYVAVGNSLTAGYASGGVSRAGQLASYPAILAGQFKAVGGGDFTQPLFSEEQANGSGYLRLTGFTAQGSPITASVTDKLAIRSMSPLRYTKYLDPIQNLAVPDIKVADIKKDTYATTNPYFERITADNNTSQTYLDRVKASTDHTFFSLWLGNNDVLSYATSGGAFSGGMLNQEARTITPVSTFDANYSELVNALQGNDTQKKSGVLGTIPDVASLPFFTTVGPSVKQVLAANNIPGMVALTGSGSSRVQIAAAQINGAQSGVFFPLTASAYAPLIGQPTGKYWRDLARQVSRSQDPAVVRLTLAGLMLNFQIDTTAMFGLSAGNPLPSALLLDAAEVQTVRTATEAFNGVIKAQAEAKGLALFDADAYFKSILGGFSADNVAYSPAFITGNLFSLDGIHPTPRGYAIVANQMIKAINAKYKSNVPMVDITQFDTIQFP